MGRTETLTLLLTSKKNKRITDITVNLTKYSCAELKLLEWPDYPPVIKYGTGKSTIYVIDRWFSYEHLSFYWMFNCHVCLQGATSSSSDASPGTPTLWIQMWYAACCTGYSGCCAACFTIKSYIYILILIYMHVYFVEYIPIKSCVYTCVYIYICIQSQTLYVLYIDSDKYRGMLCLASKTQVPVEHSWAGPCCAIKYHLLVGASSRHALLPSSELVPEITKSPSGGSEQLGCWWR